uniref:Uncharacterized protein n=1 Tax=Mesocestoides corti TaxID=53468 RepID=A0A5K3G5I4_MESCO
MLDHLASANPVSLCDPVACGKGRQPTREGHGRDAVYNERRGQRGGLGWKSSGILQWRRIRAKTCWTTWPQPILCLSVFQWHARKVSSQTEKDTMEVQYNERHG